MPTVPLHGHQKLKEQLARAASQGLLPHSLLLHGAEGIGKQRLALWLGQLLVCDGEWIDLEPCGKCRQCHMVLNLTHPDVLWVFPRPRPKSSDASPDDIREDLAAGAQERADGLYEPPSGTEGIFVATIRLVLRMAALKPAIARRKVIIVGDADRMVSQEGSDQAANAFLKLLEEPAENTFLILTTSQPGALLPTVRSRVVGARVAGLSDAAMRGWLKDEHVRKALDRLKIPPDETARARLAGGAPGRLLATARSESSADGARHILDAIGRDDPALHARVALAQGAAGARGRFSDVLEALTEGLHERLQGAATSGDTARARATAVAIARVEEAKREASGNVNPQLITAALFHDLRP